MYQLAVVTLYVLAFLGLLEIWPAILHFHYADIKPSLLWEVPIRVGVMPFLLGALMSSLSNYKERAPAAAFAIAPATTFLLNGLLQQTQFDWWGIAIFVVAGACSVLGAWTIGHFAIKKSVATKTR